MAFNAQIGFSTPKSFNPVSWLIRKITRSQCSHAWVKYHDEDLDLDMVMEAHELGFRGISFDHFTKYNTIVKLIPVDVDVTPGLRLLARQLGNGYDYGGLIGMSIVMLLEWCRRQLKWTWIKIKNPLHAPGHLFCSAAIVLMLEESHSKMVEDMLVPETIAPQKLLDLLSGKS
jgi:hypothetical protein